MQSLMDERETKSIHSGVTYNQSAIGEMNQGELDQLLALKERRIREIRDRYLESSAQIPTYHQKLAEEKDAFMTKQKYKDNSLAYPTYGRGLLPEREMNTFMIQPNLAGSPEQKKGEGADPNSPQASVQARQRRKIRSPKRLRFENNFENFMNTKYVEQPISEIPAKEEEMMQRPKMDFYTKVEGSKNATVQKNQERLCWQRKKREASLNSRNLQTIEKDAEQLMAEERVVNLEKKFIENMRRVFVKSKLRNEEHLENVLKQEFFDNLCSDEFFESIIETADVRESVDGERETLDQLLFRVDKEHAYDRITWDQFLENFTKRGKLRKGEQIVFGPPLKTREEVLAETQRLAEEDPEHKQFQLMRKLKEKMVGKMNLVPKDGKGKYDITVPEPPRFLKHKHKKTIRQQRLE